MKLTVVVIWVNGIIREGWNGCVSTDAVPHRLPNLFQCRCHQTLRPRYSHCPVTCTSNSFCRRVSQFVSYVFWQNSLFSFPKTKKIWQFFWGFYLNQQNLFKNMYAYFYLPRTMRPSINTVLFHLPQRANWVYVLCTTTTYSFWQWGYLTSSSSSATDPTQVVKRACCTDLPPPPTAEATPLPTAEPPWPALPWALPPSHQNTINSDGIQVGNFYVLQTTTT